jgi:predicted neutral ceramidase superfamily lipid hydrolase
LINKKSSEAAANTSTHSSKNLITVALALAAVTAFLHLYIGILVYGIPLGIPLILIALVYMGGIGLIAKNIRRELWLKTGIYWIIIVIVLWAASAAVNAPNTNIPLAYASKAVEFTLLGILLRLRRASRP